MPLATYLVTAAFETPHLRAASALVTLSDIVPPRLPFTDNSNRLPVRVNHFFAFKTRPYVQPEYPRATDLREGPATRQELLCGFGG
jgi:hypothetical protein